MATANPYVSPSSDLAIDSEEFGTAPIFSFSTRIGRLRYLARTGVSTFVFYAVIGLAAGLAFVGGGGSDAAAAIAGLAYIAGLIGMIVIGFMFGAQRLHDLDRSGWLVLLMFIPLVNIALGLYLLFAGGTQGDNDYGPPPPPNTLGVKIGALVFPLIFIVGVLAAIAIPAYQDYLTRAQAAQAQYE